MSERQPFQCFDRGYLLRLGAAALVAFGLGFAAKTFGRGTTATLALVGLECVAVAYIIVATVGMIRRLDEMNLRIHHEAITFSFTTTAVLGSALVLLERAGLPLGGWERWLWGFMALVWGIGVVVIERRYR